MKDRNSLIGKMVKHHKPLGGVRAVIPGACVPCEVLVVELMAVADGYAMVHRLGCMPYVAPLKEIEL